MLWVPDVIGCWLTLDGGIAGIHNASEIQDFRSENNSIVSQLIPVQLCGRVRTCVLLQTRARKDEAFTGNRGEKVQTTNGVPRV